MASSSDGSGKLAAIAAGAAAAVAYATMHARPHLAPAHAHDEVTERQEARRTSSVPQQPPPRPRQCHPQPGLSQRRTRNTGAAVVSSSPPPPPPPPSSSATAAAATTTVARTRPPLPRVAASRSAPRSVRRPAPSVLSPTRPRARRHRHGDNSNSNGSTRSTNSTSRNSRNRAQARERMRQRDLRDHGPPATAASSQASAGVDAAPASTAAKAEAAAAAEAEATREAMLGFAVLLLLFMAYRGWALAAVVGLGVMLALRRYSAQRRRARGLKRAATGLLRRLRYDPSLLQGLLGAAGVDSAAGACAGTAGGLPPWVEFPDVEKCEWLQGTLNATWPFLRAAIGTELIAAIQPELDALCAGDGAGGAAGEDKGEGKSDGQGGGDDAGDSAGSADGAGGASFLPFKKLTIRSCDIGSNPPQITGIKGYPGEGEASFSGHETGGAAAGVNTGAGPSRRGGRGRDRGSQGMDEDAHVTLDMGLALATEASAILLDVQLLSGLEGLCRGLDRWGLSRLRSILPADGPVLTIELSDVVLSLPVRMVLKPLLDELPCIAGMTFCFTSRPLIDFSLSTLHGALDVMEVPFVSDAITEAVRDAVSAAMVWPHSAFVPFVYSSELKTRAAKAKLRRCLTRMAAPRPQGVLEIVPIAARRLRPGGSGGGRGRGAGVADRSMRRDIAVRLELGGRSWTSSTVRCFEDTGRQSVAAGEGASFSPVFSHDGGECVRFPVFDRRMEAVRVVLEGSRSTGRAHLMGTARVVVADLFDESLDEGAEGNDTTTGIGTGSGFAAGAAVEHWISLQPSHDAATYDGFGGGSGGTSGDGGDGYRPLRRLARLGLEAGRAVRGVVAAAGVASTASSMHGDGTEGETGHNGDSEDSGEGASAAGAIALRLRWLPLRRPAVAASAVVRQPGAGASSPSGARRRHHRASVADMGEAGAARTRGLLFVSVFRAPHLRRRWQRADQEPFTGTVSVVVSLGAGGGSDMLTAAAHAGDHGANFGGARTSTSTAAAANVIDASTNSSQATATRTRWGAQRAQRVRSRPVRVAGESAQWAPPFRGIIIVDHAPCDELLLTVLEDSTAQEEKIGTVSIPVGRVRALGRVRGTRALQPPGAGALEMELEWLDF